MWAKMKEEYSCEVQAGWWLECDIKWQRNVM